ncbi:MAG: AtpZ/AtpI family protein [Candidatus Chaera renei]|uniref:AtpZ/AtpI family protein n=1 Tax=Candidatus Chaera renei TaxID=2506947 RepID=A0A4Q0AIK2_9BACT|nr:MAG: AtpZ/AtpI family protein [Candidatus Chaera renei]
MARQSLNSSQGDHHAMPAGRLVWLFTTVADTTWRMFVPSLGAIAAGWLADRTWQIKPWGLVGGVLAGAAVSAWLVARQLKRQS